jgi:hypothetical protein
MNPICKIFAVVLKLCYVIGAWRKGCSFLETILANDRCLLWLEKTVLWIRIRIDFGRLELDPDPEGKKDPTTKNRDKFIVIFYFKEIFFKKFQLVKFYNFWWSWNLWVRIRIDLKCWIRICADPQHWKNPLELKPAKREYYFCQPHV